MRYGYHQARSTDALTWLLTHEPTFAATELPVILACRKTLLGAHRERCERATRGGNVCSVLFENPRLDRDIAGLARGGAVALSHLLDEYPTFEPYTIRFTDALQADPLSPYGQAWVEAARHALLATETALSSPEWTTMPGQAWQIVADISDAAEATVAIDRDLEPSAKTEIPGWQTELRIPSAELRLAARHIGYVARAGDLDPAADAITRIEPVNRPQMLRTVEDLVVGVRVTERLLRRGGLSIRDLRSFALMQSDIAHTCAGMVTDPLLEPLRESFRRRDVQFRDLAGATVRVASVGPSSGRAVLAQTQEMGRVLLEVRRTGRSVTAGVLADFDAEHPRLAASLAENVGRALATGRYLVVDDKGVSLQWRRMQPGENSAVADATEKAINAARAEDAAADIDFAVQKMAAVERASVLERVSRPTMSSRATLRATLDRKPYGRRPPMPNRRPSQLL